MLQEDFYFATGEMYLNYTHSFPRLPKISNKHSFSCFTQGHLEAVSMVPLRTVHMFDSLLVLETHKGRYRTWPYLATSLAERSMNLIVRNNTKANNS